MRAAHSSTFLKSSRIIRSISTQQDGESPGFLAYPTGVTRSSSPNVVFQTRQVLGCFGPAVSKKYLTRKDGTRLDRGGRGSLRMFVRMLPMILMLIMHKSRGYALAELVVPGPTTKPL